MRIGRIVVLFCASLASAAALPRATAEFEKAAIGEPAKDPFSTIEQARAAEDFNSPETKVTADFEKRASAGEIQCSVGSNGAARSTKVAEVLRDLTKKWPTAGWVVDPHSCNRVGCTWGSAVWACSDAETRIWPRTADIVEMGNKLSKECYGYDFEGYVKGRGYVQPEWNVIIGASDC